jgi:hypothetical protein
MRVLLDHCVDVHFAKLVVGHEVSHAKTLGWESLSNGKLLDIAELNEFDVMITVDKGVRFQQNIAKRRISLITLNPLLVDYDYIAPMASQLLLVLLTGLSPGSQIVIDP